MQATGVIKKILGAAFVLTVCVACSTMVGMEESVPISTPQNSVDNLADTDSDGDPNRIVCRRYQASGVQKGEKICMTARQWERKSDGSARTLDNGQQDSEVGE